MMEAFVSGCLLLIARANEITYRVVSITNKMTLFISLSLIYF